MFIYFLMFLIFGFIISKIVNKDKKSFLIIIICISIIWSIIYSPIWGLISLGEMTLGYFIANFIESKK